MRGSKTRLDFFVFFVVTHDDMTNSFSAGQDQDLSILPKNRLPKDVSELPFFLHEVQKETPISWRIHVEHSTGGCPSAQRP